MTKRPLLLELLTVTALIGCNLGDEPGLRGPDTDVPAQDSSEGTEASSDSVVTADSDAATDSAEVGDAKTKVIAYPDFNGDGRADLWCYGPFKSGNVGHFDVYSSATGMLEFESKLSLYPWATNDDQWAGAADFDGDGISEVFKTELGGGRFRVAKLVAGALKEVGGTDSWCRGYETFVGDFNGDHRQDFACINEVDAKYDGAGSNLWIATSTSTPSAISFDSPTAAALQHFCDWTTSRDNVLATWGAGKIDGDGFEDVWCHDLRTGTGFAGRTIWAKSDGKGTLKAQSISLLEGFCAGPSLHFGAADFDGDGDLDFYCHHPVGADATSTGQIEVVLNDGGKFAPSDVKVWHASWCTRPKARIGAGDFDGDGKADLYCHDDLGTTFALAKGTAFVVPSQFLSGCTYDRNELHARD